MAKHWHLTVLNIVPNICISDKLFPIKMACKIRLVGTLCTCTIFFSALLGQKYKYEVFCLLL
jgi:hypothetical protein